MRRTITAAFLITLFAATIWGQEPTRNDPAAVEILEKYIAATGGRQAWSALKNVRDTTEVTVMGTVRNVVNVHERATGRFYTRTEQKDGLIESGYDGTHAWQRTPMFRGILKDTEPQALAAKRSGKSLVEYRESSRVFRREPDETVDGRKEIVLSSTEPDPIGRNIETRYYFDPQTYLLDQSVSGGAIKQTTRMEDYRKTPAGVLVPFTRTVVSPQVTVVTHVRSWEANVTIDPTIFSYDTNGSEPAGEKKAAAAPAAPVTPPVAFKQKDEIPEALRLATFEHVWQKVNDSYWDPTFGGIDWKKVHDDFLPRARAAKASDEYHRVLNDMVTQLGRSHFRVTRPDQTIGLHSQASDLQNYGFIGLSSQWIDDQLVATAVVPDFPAARAGIRKGYVIQKVNGKTPAEIYEMKLRESTGYHLRKEIALPRAVEELLAGRVGEPVAPTSFSGRLTNANSRAPVAARSSSSRFSKIRMPARASSSVWLGSEWPSTGSV